MLCVHMRCPRSAARQAWSARLSFFPPEHLCFNLGHVVGTNSILFQRDFLIISLVVSCRCVRHKPSIIPVLGTAPKSGAVQGALGTRLGAASPSGSYAIKLYHKLFSSGGTPPCHLPLNISHCTLESFGHIPESLCERTGAISMPFNECERGQGTDYSFQRGFA